MSKATESNFLIAYYANLVADKEMAMNYLHQTVTWQITVFLGGTIIVLSQLDFPSVRALIVLSLLAICSVHFALRAGKAYLNMMRWALIERRFLSRQNWSASDNLNPAAITDAIETYHRRWVSPLSTANVLHKLIFELGFGVQILVLLALLVACATEVDATHSAAILLFASIWIFAEVYFNLWVSPYFRIVRPDDETLTLR